MSFDKHNRHVAQPPSAKLPSRNGRQTAGGGCHTVWLGNHRFLTSKPIRNLKNPLENLSPLIAL
jgi:hypothetical protein